MCGIAGSYAFSGAAATEQSGAAALDCLRLRGPDDHGTYTHGPLWLGHTRLSIIDTSTGGHQPMTDASGRYTIAYNGELYNYRALRHRLEKSGCPFRSQSDTEVLLHAWIRWGPKCLQEFLGFFAFALYDSHTQRLVLVRDRMGIKPMYYYHGSDRLAFASEMKALTALGVPRVPDRVAVMQYLQLNYIPAPHTLLQDVYKLEPGEMLTVDQQGVQRERWYTIPEGWREAQAPPIHYDEAQYQLIELMDRSVQDRLVADVQVGAFLSGGVDSSIVVALASRYVDRLHTFSIGFRDHKQYDETAWAWQVARTFRTRHEAFYLGDAELLLALHRTLDYMDEPFADSSAIAVHVLSEYTKRYVSVALSGDGGDELFAGYHKHRGEWLARHGGLRARTVAALKPLWWMLPKARHTPGGNRVRQLYRFAEGARLSAAERYWRWCGFANMRDTLKLLDPAWLAQTVWEAEFEGRKEHFTRYITPKGSLNEVLYADMHLVLPNDMLTKVDRMSMANSLEVRVPFLDHRLVEYAFRLPEHFKIDRDGQKRILKDAFQHYLPAELLHRPKQGFELPLTPWLRGSLHSMVFDTLLHPDRIAAQGIFNPDYIRKLERKLRSNNPGDAPARIYGLMVFQHCWGKLF